MPVSSLERTLAQIEEVAGLEYELKLVNYATVISDRKFTKMLEGPIAPTVLERHRTAVLVEAYELVVRCEGRDDGPECVNYFVAGSGNFIAHSALVRYPGHVEGYKGLYTTASFIAQYIAANSIEGDILGRSRAISWSHERHTQDNARHNELVAQVWRRLNLQEVMPTALPVALQCG